MKPVQFGVDPGLSGMEVQLVAGAQEAVVAPGIVQDNLVPPPIVQEKDAVIEDPIKKSQPIKNSPSGNISMDASSSNHGAMTEAQPFYLRNPAPGYPRKARQNGWEGKVLLKILVDKNGHPVKVEIEKSSGHSILDDAALKTVKTWRFSPAHLGSIPVESFVCVPVKFELE